jgi:hypothetical protein
MIGPEAAPEASRSPGRREEMGSDRDCAARRGEATESRPRASAQPEASPRTEADPRADWVWGTAAAFAS